MKIIELIREGKEDVEDYYYRYVNKAFTEISWKNKITTYWQTLQRVI